MANEQNPIENNNKANWLTCWWHWRTEQVTDNNIVEIGDNPYNVVVGKNIIQIGTLQIPFYLAAVIALCLLIGVGFVAYPSVKPWLPKPLAFAPAAQNETLIVIATFKVTEGNHNTLPQREIRDKIREKIQELHETNLRVEVEPTELTSDQQDEAKQLGESYKASMVIWGDDTGARVTVNFLNLRQPDFDAASVPISETVRSQLANPSAYAQFITDDLPRKMSFLVFFAVGQAHYMNTQYASAIKSIEAAISQLPSGARLTGLADAYFRLGWLYLVSSLQLDQAIVYYTQALKLKADYAAAYLNRGTALYVQSKSAEDAQGKLAEAIADYDQALKLNPNLAAAYYNRGKAHSDQHKLAEAIADYDQALKLSPDLAEAYYNRGAALYAQSKLAEAIADYDQALKLNPADAITYNNRGIARYDQGKLGAAIADYDQALKLNPADADAYYNRGIARKAQGKLVEAIADYDQALKLNPSLAAAYYNRGNAYSDQRKLAEAIADYDQVLHLRPDLAEAYYNRGNAYSAQGKLAEAIADYDQALKFKPDDASAYHNRGLSYHQLGEFNKALADFQHYRELQPTADDRTQVEQWITELEAKLVQPSTMPISPLAPPSIVPVSPLARPIPTG